MTLQLAPAVPRRTNWCHNEDYTWTHHSTTWWKTVSASVMPYTQRTKNSIWNIKRFYPCHKGLRCVALPLYCESYFSFYSKLLTPDLLLGCYDALVSAIFRWIDSFLSSAGVSHFSPCFMKSKPTAPRLHCSQTCNSVICSHHLKWRQFWGSISGLSALWATVLTTEPTGLSYIAALRYTVLHGFGRSSLGPKQCSLCPSAAFTHVRAATLTGLERFD
jgi:hypothetical protein